ncbi:MAG: RpiB/LacA/LacB family sugar-phosphate isomerase [Candidatus Paceibacterota bacterium]|jgi:ribose 5-phosphate isomerase B
MIYLGSDHRGFELKEKIKNYLDEQGLDHEDLGNLKYDALDDFPDFARAVAEKVAENPTTDKGILICGSGVGVDIAANRIKGIRSALVSIPEAARLSRKDDNTNILSLGADFVTDKKAEEIIDIWLHTEFSGEEKYTRRINKIDQ